MGRSTVLAPARVTSPGCITIGDDVLIMEHVFLSVVPAFPDIVPRLVFEDGVVVGRGCGFAVVGEVVMGRGATIGDFSLVADTFHPYEVLDRLPAVVRPKPVRIGEGAVLGSHVVVLPGVTIGAGAYVEHHAVVGRDVPPGGVVADYDLEPARMAG
jgi:acetyltransferase-like isoleucine patch superfamily enzyme